MCMRDPRGSKYSDRYRGVVDLSRWSEVLLYMYTSYMRMCTAVRTMSVWPTLGYRPNWGNCPSNMLGCIITQMAGYNISAQRHVAFLELLEHQN